MRMMIGLISVMLGSLWATLGIWSPGNEHPATHPRRVAADDKAGDGREHAARQWALGCAAVLTERNYDSHTTLAGGGITEQSRLSAERLLSDSWGIGSREELLDTLAWLDEKGHRADFARLGREIFALSQKVYDGLLAGANDPETINKIRIAREYYVQLGSKSLYGWDFGRAICLCRWGYTAGYLSEEEAWERILAMARQLQAIFDSWEDLGQNYLVGRRFWSYEATTKDAWLYEDAVQRLLDMRDSPWNRYPWDLDLSEGDPQRDEPARLPDAIVASR